MKTQQITTPEQHHDRFITDKMFSDYLIKKGYQQEKTGGYRSPCDGHLVSLIDLQISLDRLADFEGRTTESIFQEMSR